MGKKTWTMQQIKSKVRFWKTALRVNYGLLFLTFLLVITFLGNEGVLSWLDVIGFILLCNCVIFNIYRFKWKNRLKKQLREQNPNGDYFIF